ncbi:hypothetical protein [uncultured Brevundimonas sp.]|nr:hypothetical protein [uncultured Brevundimonas sp.]
MAARMDGYAAREALPGMRAEWVAMASYWRGLAHQADWQDRYRARSS